MQGDNEKCSIKRLLFFFQGWLNENGFCQGIPAAVRLSDFSSR